MAAILSKPLQRFRGTCEPLGLVDVIHLHQWIVGIDFAKWPQQHRLADGKIRPAMVTDLGWHGFGAETDPLVKELVAEYFPGCVAYNRMLSVVMPGAGIDAHRDVHPQEWICRVHVPLATNPDAELYIRLARRDPMGTHNLDVGRAYKINTEAMHCIYNGGETPRIHLMFDVKEETHV